MWRYSLILNAAILIILKANVTKAYKADASYRLPRSIHPNRYNLTIEPVLQINNSSTFTGSILIELNVFENTKNITLHAKNLDISDESINIIKNGNGSQIKIMNTTIDVKRQFYIISLEEDLITTESYTLIIGHFSGKLEFDKFGFYLAKYKDTLGKDRILALTDFQPNGAREAFPCFDEPALKAKFIINIIREEKYTTVSNEELSFTQYLGNGRFQDTYKETVLMSTYLIAFTISDYERTVQNRRHRIFSQPQAIEIGLTNYTLFISGDLLSALENFTGINYTFTKLDLFGVPREYFEPGGMENWGLITLSENYIFCSNTSSTTFDMQKCTTFVGHEFSHQWFGNLVTPLWWNYLWLSEGFATYLEYYIPSTLNPSWRLMEQFEIYIQQKILEYDGNTLKKHLNYDLEHTGKLPHSGTSYFKGSCIIKMTSHFLTPKIFQKGVHIYLQDNKFDSVEPSDLYLAFQTAIDEENSNDLLGNLTVADIVQTWDSNIGYPLVSVTRDYKNGSVAFSQQPFFSNSLSQNATVWYIPISYALHSGNKHRFTETSSNFWLTEETSTFDNFTTTSWILVNIQQAGYYRVNYDLTNWERLITFLNTDEFEIIHPVNRAQLIDDSFNLAKWNYIPYTIPLNLSRYLTRERDYIPISSFLNNINTLNPLLAATKSYDNFRNYVISLLVPTIESLGFVEKESDTHLDKLNRANILTWLCKLGHKGLMKIGLEKLKEWKLTKTPSFSADLEAAFLCSAMQTGEAEDWEFLHEKYEQTNCPIRKSRIFLSLGCSRNTTILTKLHSFLDMIFNTTNNISTREQTAALENIVQANPEGLQVALNYFIENVENLHKIFDTLNVAHIIGKRIAKLDQLEQLSMALIQLRATNNRLILTCLVQARRNFELVSKIFSEEISDWLAIYNYNNI